MIVPTSEPYTTVHNIEHNKEDPTSDIRRELLRDDDLVNPFLPNSKVSRTPQQRLKMFFVGLAMVPVRFVVTAIGFFGASFVAWLYVTLFGPKTEEERKHPMPFRSRTHLRLLRFFGRLSLWGCGYWYIDQRDLCNYGKRPDGSLREAPVVITNHVTIIDGFFLITYHDMMALGKKSLVDAPFVSSIGAAEQVIGVDRESPEARKATAEEICRRVQWPPEKEQQYGRFRPMIIFPEGTCTNTSCMVEFRLGAFQPGVAVQPIILRYPYRHYDCSWCDTGGFLWILLGMWCQVYNRMEAMYLPVYEPSDEEKKDPVLFARNVRRAMSEASKIPLTDHNYLDMLALHCADECGLDSHNINIEMGKFKFLGLDRVKACLRRFAGLDSDRDGFLTLEDFAAYTGLLGEYPTLLRGMFESWTAGSARGMMSFRQFLVVTTAKVRKVDGAAPAAEDGSLFLPEASDEERAAAARVCFETFFSRSGAPVSVGPFSATMRRLTPLSELGTAAFDAEMQRMFTAYAEPNGGGMSSATFAQLACRFQGILEQFLTIV